MAPTKVTMKTLRRLAESHDGELYDDGRMVEVWTPRDGYTTYSYSTREGRVRAIRRAIADLMS